MKSSQKVVKYQESKKSRVTDCKMQRNDAVFLELATGIEPATC